MRSVVISSGHGKYVRGASGFVDEVEEARKVVDDVALLLRDVGVEYKTFHDDTSTTQDQNLKRIVGFHNAQTRDLDVSVHFNAYQTTTKPMGVEVLYVTQQKLASALSQAIAGTAGLINRGGKKRSDLYFLNNTAKPAILIEVCFCDSRADVDIYQAKFAAICNVIASVVGDVVIPGVPPTEPPVEPVEPPVPLPPAEQAVVDITIKVTGNAVVSINGQDFQIAEPVDPEAPSDQLWQKGIEATVFGGASDPNDSAYPPYGFIDDNVLGVALPWRWRIEPRPQVIVRNVVNGKQVIAEIVDVGPWMIDDDYWGTSSRPVAETCYVNKNPLPSGPNKGLTPTNGAGIDLTPATAKAVGISGKGMCDWAFAFGEGLEA